MTNPERIPVLIELLFDEMKKENAPCLKSMITGNDSLHVMVDEISLALNIALGSPDVDEDTSVKEPGPNLERLDYLIDCLEDTEYFPGLYYVDIANGLAGCVSSYRSILTPEADSFFGIPDSSLDGIDHECPATSRKLAAGIIKDKFFLNGRFGD